MTPWFATASWTSDMNFLQKPFTPSSLANKVRQVLDQNTNA